MKGSNTIAVVVIIAKFYNYIPFQITCINIKLFSHPNPHEVAKILIQGNILSHSKPEQRILVLLALNLVLTQLVPQCIAYPIT